MNVLVQADSGNRIAQLTRVPCLGERIYGFGNRVVTRVIHSPAEDPDVPFGGAVAMVVLSEAP